MKTRFLFPGIYLGIILSELFLEAVKVSAFLNAPVTLLMIGIEIVWGSQISEPRAVVLLLGCIQFVLIGLVWDKISERFAASGDADPRE